MENEKALVDIAYDVLKTYYKSKKKKNMVKVPFKEILEKVGEEKGIDSQQQLIDLASTFYTALTIDGRFFQNEDNTWSLKEYEKFEDIHKVNVTSDQDIDDDEIDEGNIIEANTTNKLDYEDEEDSSYDEKDENDYNIDIPETDEDEN